MTKDHLHTYGFRTLGGACLVAVAANVIKHGWHPGSVLLGSSLAALLISLGIPPAGRGASWQYRYLLLKGASAVLLARVVWELTIR